MRREQIPAESDARKPYTRYGKVFAAVILVCLVVGVLLVAAFPDGWLAWLLEASGPALFCLVVISPALVLGFVMEARGIKFYRDKVDDAYR